MTAPTLPVSFFTADGSAWTWAWADSDTARQIEWVPSKRLWLALCRTSHGWQSQTLPWRAPVDQDDAQRMVDDHLARKGER